MRLRLAVLLTGVAGVVGGNPACNEEVIRRLVGDCGIIFAIAQPICPGLGGVATAKMPVRRSERWG